MSNPCSSLLVHHGAFPALVVGFLAVPLCAQKMPPSNVPGDRIGGTPSIVGPSVFTSEQSGMQSSALLRYPDSEQFPGLKVEEEKCLPWAVSTVRGATVSVMRLEVPSRARSEFEKACGA